MVSLYSPSRGFIGNLQGVIPDALCRLLEKSRRERNCKETVPIIVGKEYALSAKK